MCAHCYKRLVLHSTVPHSQLSDVRPVHDDILIAKMRPGHVRYQGRGRGRGRDMTVVLP